MNLVKQRKYGKYFRHNMRLYTAIFAVICLAVAGLYLWNVTRHQTQQIQREYQSDANRIAIELDNQLERIQDLMKDISGITWVQKLSTSSDVFLKDFTALEIIECQKELSRYLAVDEAITDIAVYLPDRGKLLCQKGWFSAGEYRSYLKNRRGLDADEIFAAAAGYNAADAYLTWGPNLENGQSVVIIRSLVNVSSPAASLILVLDRNVFNRSIRKLGDGALHSVQMRNADGNVLFQTYREAEGYELTVASGILPASYRMVYAPPSEVRNRYGVVNLAFCGTLLLALALGVTTAYLLSLHNLRPLNKLLNTINRLLGDAPDRPAEDSEFDRIESSFAELYAQKQGLQKNIRENYNLTRQYALMLALSGDRKLGEWTRHFNELSIPFTEEQYYSVWIVVQRQDPPEQIDWAAVLFEVLPELSSVEEIGSGAAQAVVILGQKELPARERHLEAAEGVKQLAMERYGVLAEFQIGECKGPGVEGIAQSYHGLTAGDQKAKDPAYGKTGRELAQYIRENFCDPNLSLKELGGRWNLSVPTVSRLCKEALGVSFVDYLTGLRLEKAKELLKEKSLTPAEIAQAVGYGSEYSFRRAFQRSENCRLQDWVPPEE